MRTDTGPVFKLEDYKPADFVIETVDLNFVLAPEATQVTSTMTLRRRPGTAPDAPLVLDGDGLSLDAIAIDGAPIDAALFDAQPDRLTVRDLPEQAAFNLTIQTTINPSANTQLMGLYRSNGTYCTQCEAEGFRRITYFLDRPDVLAVYTVRIEGEHHDTPLLLSNGNRVEAGELEDGRHYAVWHDPHPKPAYLFALVAGNLGCLTDNFVTQSGRDVALEIYVEHGNEPRATYAMDALKRSMRWDEERFGREYDLDVFMIVAVSDFNMGAMENKGLNIFNDKYVLADPATATDQDYANIEAIVAHEYFHNWTGNRITCRDWFQLCLKEGLTVYRDHEFSADMRERGVKRIAEVRLLRSHQFPEDNGPLAHPVRPKSYREINNFYTATVYEKGSEVVRMLRTILGADGFKAGLDLYFDRHDGEAATIEQFLACFAEATGTDLTQFALWYDQPGTPNVAVQTAYDAKAGQLTVTLSQSLKAPVAGASNEPMHIPVAFGLLGPEGEELGWDKATGGAVAANGRGETVMHLTKPSQDFVFEGVPQQPVVSILHGFSAPVTHVPGPSEDELVFIARHERDEFARWDALNTLVTRKMCALVAKPGKIDGDDPVIAALLAVGSDEGFGHAYRALCLTLPTEQDIAREIGHRVDPDAVFSAVQSVNLAVANQGARLFGRLYHGLQSNAAFSPDARDAGRRALRNRALSYLSLCDRDLELAAAAFADADNMTDKDHALRILVHHGRELEATKAGLEAFFRQYRSDHGALDKWFAIQASAPGHTTLDAVLTLSRLPSFSWDNPNRVRALVGAFATGSPTGFNRPDGKGYDFLCQTVARLDKTNPQVAARLLTAMRSWKSLEPDRAALAKRALETLASADTRSRDVREMVDRMLS